MGHGLQNKPDWPFLLDICPCIFSSFPKSDNDFVEDFLVDEYFNTVYTDLAERRAIYDLKTNFILHNLRFHDSLGQSSDAY